MLGLASCCVVFVVLTTMIGDCLMTIPRGVDPQLATFYNPGRNFQCLDGSASIFPFSFINDNYCDCEDGSDEPGTSACSNGSFYCSNVGFRSRKLISSRVNDGICDCCDGSDEWDSELSCSNDCERIGETIRRIAIQRAKMIQEALTLKESMSHEGLKLKTEKMNLIADKERLRAEAEQTRIHLEEKKSRAESLEKEALDVYRQAEEEQRVKEEEAAKLEEEENIKANFQQLDANGDGVVDSPEVQSNFHFDQDEDGIVSAEEADHFLSGKDSYNLDEFRETGWAIMKSYIKGEEDKETPQQTPSIEPHTEEERGDRNEVDEEDEEEQDYGDENLDVPPPSVSPAEETEKNESLYDPDTQKLIEEANVARSAYLEAERLVQGLDVEIEGLNKELSISYGNNEEFLPLNKNCYELSNAEYVYKMCAFEYCSQKSRNGGPETRLGNWNRWHSSYDTMFYDKGQQCWNGPVRSTVVRMSCGLENKLVSSSELNKCEYEFHFETPAACTEKQLVDLKNIHDEL